MSISCEAEIWEGVECAIYCENPTVIKMYRGGEEIVCPFEDEVECELNVHLKNLVKK